VINGTFTFAHAGFGRFSGDGFIGENPNPVLTTPAHVPSDGPAYSLNLAAGNPAWFKGL
jgi:hypothetical protein